MRSEAMLIVCALGLVPGVARADAPADAIALFDQGIKDLQAGNTEVACRELAASLAKYPDSGTKGALAECYTKLGKVASAWKLWKDLADTAPVELRADAADSAAKLDARLPRYQIKLGAPPPTGLHIEIDGIAVADPTLSVPLPVDPGAFTVSASAPAYKPWTQQFQAVEGQVTTVEVPSLEALPPEQITPPVVTPTTGAGAPPVAQPTTIHVVEDTSGARHTRHVIGGATVLVGVAALGAGTYFGLAARTKWNDAKTTCGGAIDGCAGANVSLAQAQVDDARSAAMLSTVTFAAGGAAIVIGAIVWLSAPSAEHRVAVLPTVDAHGSGLALTGSF